MAATSARALFLLALSGFFTQAAAQELIPTVFVGPHVREGFADMDAGIRDSIRDIQLEIRSESTRRELHEFRLAATPDSAMLVVTVLARGIVTNSAIGTSSIAGGNGFGFVVPSTVPTLTTTLRVGNKYERRMHSEGATWRTAAKMVVQDLAAWWDANRAVFPRRQ